MMRDITNMGCSLVHPLGNLKTSFELEYQQQQVFIEQVQGLSKALETPMWEDVSWSPMDVSSPLSYDMQCRYYVFLAFGTLELMSNSFFFGAALFSLFIPSLPDYTLMLVSLGYAMIEGVLFICFDAHELREALDLAPQDEIGRYLALYEAQWAWTYCCRMLLLNQRTSMCKPDDYERYVCQFEHSLTILTQVLQQLRQRQEHLGHQVLRYSVLALGAISSLTNSYFMITLCCPFLLNSVLGCLVILSIMGIGLGFHFYMKSTSLTRMVDPYETRVALLKAKLTWLIEDPKVTRSHDGSRLRAEHARFFNLTQKSVEEGVKQAPYDDKIKYEP